MQHFTEVEETQCPYITLEMGIYNFYFVDKNLDKKSGKSRIQNYFLFGILSPIA